MIRVLWLDDECKKPEMIQFKIEAENLDLYLEGFESFEEGFQHLDKNLNRYDIILLDGLFLERKNQEKGTEDESGLGMAISKINELKSKKIFPWFVLSGKDTFTKGDNSLLKGNKAKCFDKTNPAEVVQLLNEMKKAAEDLEEYKLKQKFQNVLESCSFSFLGEENFSRLFILIKHISSDTRVSNTEDLLNPIRKIIERLFTRLCEIEVIPQSILQNNGWINNCSKFLSNKHSDFEQTAEIVPPIISESIFRLLNIIQDASHSEGELKLKVDIYLKNSQSDYFYRSVIFLLFDLLIWFKDFINQNQDIVRNKGRWEIKPDFNECIEGTIIRIKENGWADFIPFNQTEIDIKPIGIPPAFVTRFKLITNDKLKVITKPNPNGQSPHIKDIIK